jgi:pimeloyl-ACP methyl ester carboxylesterase
MRYFNGFSLNGEEELFKDILISSDYTLAGFSYGAILAFEEALNSKERVDRLILISPAFFQNRDRRFKSLQLKAWERNKEDYILEFLNRCSFPTSIKLDKYLKIGTKEELETLLNYTWQIEKLKQLKQKGVTVELFLGAKDKIIRSDEVLEFFGDFAVSYLFKEAGHILR